MFWIGHGVRIFRVDNPHTKPFPFWEWTIGEIKREYPDVLFLSEAFTRPKIMYRLGSWDSANPIHISRGGMRNTS